MTLILGPELPRPLHGAAMLEHPFGGVVLMGGASGLLLSGVNFINILCGPFLYESKLRSFLLIRFNFVIFGAKIWYKKRTSKTLMKLTAADVNGSGMNEIYRLKSLNENWCSFYEPLFCRQLMQKLS